MPRPVVATIVTNDEKCYLLFEKVGMAPGSRGWRRQQVLTVVRGDHLVDVVCDLGPAASFTAPEFCVPGGVQDYTTKRFEILHTVGELRDIADYHRAGYLPMPHVEPSDLIGGYHDQQDKNKKARRRSSHFGPLMKVQRG